MRVGLGFSEDIPRPAQAELARTVEAAGFASLWTNQVRGRDALLLCQTWADATRTLQIGVAVLPIWTRSVVQLASAVATLQEASSGRFILGIGVSHPRLMERAHGLDYRRPLTAVAETLHLLNELQHGVETDLDGEVVSSRGFKLDITPRPPPAPVFIAAMGPRMLELSGTAADGVFLNWSTPAEVARARETVATAAASAGRARPQIAAYVRVAVGKNRPAARSALAAELGRYCLLPAYAEHFRRQGFGPDVDRIGRAAADGGDIDFSTILSDDMLSNLGWYGTPGDRIDEVIHTYRDAGLDHLITRVVAVGDDPVVSVRKVVDAYKRADSA